MQKSLGRFNAGFGLALAITSILTALLVVLKETNKGLKEGLKALLGHHWTTHGMLTVLVFVILGLLLSQRHWQINGRQLAGIILGGTILGSLIITGFFLVH